jgi:hypothetical protein
VSVKRVSYWLEWRGNQKGKKLRPKPLLRGSASTPLSTAAAGQWCGATSAAMAVGQGSETSQMHVILVKFRIITHSWGLYGTHAEIGCLQIGRYRLSVTGVTREGWPREGGVILALALPSPERFPNKRDTSMGSQERVSTSWPWCHDLENRGWLSHNSSGQ